MMPGFAAGAKPGLAPPWPDVMDALSLVMNPMLFVCPLQDSWTCADCAVIGQGLSGKEPTPVA
jgi:hypothetical protein